MTDTRMTKQGFYAQGTVLQDGRSFGEAGHASAVVHFGGTTVLQVEAWVDPKHSDTAKTAAAVAALKSGTPVLLRGKHVPATETRGPRFRVYEIAG